jgi:hypothetical protein
VSAGLTRLTRPLALMTLIKNLGRHSSGAGGGRMRRWWLEAGAAGAGWGGGGAGRRGGGGGLRRKEEDGSGVAPGAWERIGRREKER